MSPRGSSRAVLPAIDTLISRDSWTGPRARGTFSSHPTQLSENPTGHCFFSSFLRPDSFYSRVHLSVVFSSRPLSVFVYFARSIQCPFAKSLLAGPTRYFALLKCAALYKSFELDHFHERCLFEQKECFCKSKIGYRIFMKSLQNQTLHLGIKKLTCFFEEKIINFNFIDVKC